MSLVRNTLAADVVALVALVAACSGAPRKEGARSGPDGGDLANIGAVGSGGQGPGFSGGGDTVADGGSEGAVDGAGDVSIDEGSASVGLAVTIVGLSLASLDWTISGPNTYSGTIQIHDPNLVRFVLGGIAAGTGYTITLTGADTRGDPCSGTSAPFDVRAGVVNGASVVITCFVQSDAAADSPD